MNEETDEIFHKGEQFRGYVIEKLLGKGGIGAVYLVKHEVLQTYYALKVLYPNAVLQDASYVKRFLREARLATRIRHPNLVAVHDCGHDVLKNLYYLVMDYVPGGSLREMLAFEGKLDVSRAADIVAQVAMALQAAQEFSVVHRDIKPENIMIQPDGLVKLVDLGIAKAQNLGDSLKTNTDSAFGTPAYVSPEQAISSANVDARADIYSLGIVFFEMLTGSCPTRGKNAAQTLADILSDSPNPDVRDFVPDLPANVAVLVRRMTMKDLDRRIASFDGVLAELEKLGCAKVMRQANSVQFTTQPTSGMKTLLEGLDTVVPEAKLESKISKRLILRLIEIILIILAIALTTFVLKADTPKPPPMPYSALPAPTCVETASVPGEAPSLLPKGRKFNLIWNDEFKGTKLDAKKWGYRVNFWDLEDMWFAKPDENAVEVSDGTVKLKLIRRADGSFASPQLQTGSLSYECHRAKPKPENAKKRRGFWPFGRINKPKFAHKYGYWECRCKLQQNPAWWSAFWMQAPAIGMTTDPRQSGVECDVMESFSPGAVVSHMLHYNGYGSQHGRMCAYPDRINGVITLDKTVFHTFGVLWERDGYTFYIDGRQSGEKVTEKVSDTEQFILISTECQSYRTNGTWAKNLEKSLPDCFEVDYVRVYDEVP